jgi:hypothetical protein
MFSYKFHTYFWYVREINKIECVKGYFQHKLSKVRHFSGKEIHM